MLNNAFFPTWSHGIYVPGCTFLQDTKYVPITAYYCIFQKTQTLEAVKLCHLFLIFTQMYKVLINKELFSQN